MKSRFVVFSRVAALLVISFITMSMMSCTNLESGAERNKEIAIQSLKAIQESSYSELNKYFAER